jgi:hypothetical protein
MIMSSQIDQDIKARYEIHRWVLLAGFPQISDTDLSTYAFCRKIVGYDLEGFFERNHEALKAEVTRVLESLLAAE